MNPARGRVGARSRWLWGLIVGCSLGPLSAQTAQPAEWILRQPPAHHTLQLITLSGREQTRRFLASLDQEGLDMQQVATFRYRRGEELLYVVVYGSFAAPEQAKAATQLMQVPTLMPDSFLVRSVAGLQQRIRTTLQDTP